MTIFSSNIEGCLDILLFMQASFPDLQNLIGKKFSFIISGNQIFYQVNEIVLKALNGCLPTDYLMPIWQHYFEFSHKKNLIFYKNLMISQSTSYIEFVDKCISTLDFTKPKTHFLLKTIRAPPDDTPSRYQNFLLPRWPIVPDLKGLTFQEASKVCEQYYRKAVLAYPTNIILIVDGLVLLKMSNGRVVDWLSI
jgi:hypothetical protein